VAAAARREGTGDVLSNVKKQLADLTEECRLPSQLERDIVRFESRVAFVGQTIELLPDTLSEPVIKAIRSKYRKLTHAVDAFRDYVQRKSEREDHIHVLGRVQVGEFVQDSLEEIIEYLDKF
jgi:uncharacterized coiled-coil protein SlyX